MYRRRHLVQGFSCFVCVAGLGFPTQATECGPEAPDYSASRVISMGGHSRTVKVYLSGAKFREESISDHQHQIVTLVLPEQNINYLLDLTQGTGDEVHLPPRPPGPRKGAEIATDKLDDGTNIRHLRILNNGKWQELSTTVCNSQNVMTSQTFTAIDPTGQMVTGSITQDNITVGPLSKDLFKVPPNIAIHKRQ
jgi:hypothetical protein